MKKSVLDLPRSLPSLRRGDYALVSPSGIAYLAGSYNSIRDKLRAEFGPVTAAHDPREPLFGWSICELDRGAGEFDRLYFVSPASDTLQFSWGSICDRVEA